MTAALSCLLAMPAAGQQAGAVVDTAAARAQAAVDSTAARVARQAQAAEGANVQQPADPPAADPIAPPRPMPSGPPISADEVKLVFDREVYRYDGAGRRDPYKPLTDDNAGPLFEDLVLRMILHSNVPGQSIVVLADQTKKKTYRLRRGESIGNATVVAISPDQVTFAVEDFGVYRQEVLSIKPDNETEGA